MTIKRFARLSSILFCLVFLSLSANATGSKLHSTTFESEDLYFGIPHGGGATLKHSIIVSTANGVSYGVYQQSSLLPVGQVIPLQSWSGPGTAPVLRFLSLDKRGISDSHCPGLPSDWFCSKETFSITIESDDFNCPWFSGLQTLATSVIPGVSDTKSYTGPIVRSTRCDKVPIDTYDISWDPNSVKHDTVLSIDSTGGTVKSTLQTYLMESGSLCDKSKMDTRGGGCRLVAAGITLSVKGCDNGNVTTTASPYALTDKALHDINVSVNTKSMGSGTVKSTCNFQYILDQL